MFSANDFGEREEWPFKNMEVNDVVSIEIDETGRAKKGQVYVHVFGRQKGFKFKTRKMVRDGKSYVAFMRVK